ncbi:hypothetical protein F4859DRAFT_477994 [Xylaria cf. heliscus]|nr:hypothetical protein F4859DRAFT_477994 [Xylaria cf. heliscus]
MQVIPALLFLALLCLAEAGLLRAPRTATPDTQILSEFQIVTSSAPSATPPPATFIISAPTSATGTVQTQTALPYGFVGVEQSSSDPAPTEAPALNANSGPLEIVDGGNKFVQTTFWACETFPKETHCGWHEPLLEVSSGAAAPRPGGVLVRAGVVATFVAGVFFYGF